jgi:N6-adenosine-specific RNA methylase IME4
VSEWPFADLPPLTFDGLIVDPATKFETWSAKGQTKGPDAHYETMSWADLELLPVSQLCRGDALIMLWACWPTLRESLRLLERWGFRYVTGGAWHKRTKNGLSAFGTGYRLRSACEPFLIGTLGNPVTSRSERNIIDALAREHSRKPDEQYDFMERLLPQHSALAELFARNQRSGWSSWGNETDKFGAAA